MKVVAIIQARMGSTRLPGKVMRQLNGRTVLAHVIERVSACPKVDMVVVATTTEMADAVIEKEALTCGASVFRGSENDVLARYYQAAKAHQADVIVRVTSDCPLFDPELLERMLDEYTGSINKCQKLDYLSNAIERSYPRGLDAEVFSMNALSLSHAAAMLPHEREHVTPYIYEHPEQFTVRNFSESWGLGGLRWTLDTEEDWALISAIYEEFPPDRIFRTVNVIDLLQRRPELSALNQSVRQKPLMGSNP